MSKEAFGVTEEMIERFGDEIFDLGLNLQQRRGDAVRELDWDAIEANREGMGISDEEIAGKLGLSHDQVRYIRIVLEHRRFDTSNYAKLYKLGGGKRYRPDREISHES